MKIIFLAISLMILSSCGIIPEVRESATLNLIEFEDRGGQLDFTYDIDCLDCLIDEPESYIVFDVANSDGKVLSTFNINLGGRIGCSAECTQYFKVFFTTSSKYVSGSYTIKTQLHLPNTDCVDYLESVDDFEL